MLGGIATATSPDMIQSLPTPRGTLTPDHSLADLTWLRVGGPAEYLFQPADLEDLQGFLAALDPDISVFPIGVGSNLIIRDGGMRGVVIRLGRGFNDIRIEGDQIIAGAAALDAHVARRAGEAGLDLTFLRTIPGTIGGACRMNAGCYGAYVADHLIAARAVTRAGRVVTLAPDDFQFAYRQTGLDPDLILIEAGFTATRAAPDDLAAKMDDQLARRDASQPTKDRTAGSTFRNPAGFSSTGRADDSQEMKAWKLIEDAGLRGHRMGCAVMNEKHPNFLTNAGGAKAKELEDLGEYVRKKVFQNSGLQLEWEIMRVGDP